MSGAFPVTRLNEQSKAQSVPATWHRTSDLGDIAQIPRLQNCAQLINKKRIEAICMFKNAKQNYVNTGTEAWMGHL